MARLDMLSWSAVGLAVIGTTARAEAHPADEPAADEVSDGATDAHGMHPELSLVLDFAGAWFSDEDHLQSGAHDPSVTGFNLQQLELSATSVVDDYFRLDANLVFDLSGVEIEEAYGTTLGLPLRLRARFGQFLTRFGRINATLPPRLGFRGSAPGHRTSVRERGQPWAGCRASVAHAASLARRAGGILHARGRRGDSSELLR